MVTFKEKWLDTVKRNNSILCAGLDPAEYEMGRGNNGFPKGTDKWEWSKYYIKAVAPFCAAIKTNVNYWKNDDDMKTLSEIVDFAHSLNLLVIDDSKLADIGSTNDAGIYYSAKKGMDAITVAPFAGNIEEIAQQGKSRGIGIISMCLMSNPEYQNEKNKLVPVQDEQDSYHNLDIEFIEDIPYVKQYIYLAKKAKEYGIDGVVIGAPSEKNHISKNEIYKVKDYLDDLLILMPGKGAQGGDSSMLWKYFDKNQVIVNMGRSLMFPLGSNSDFENHRETARFHNTLLNDIREISLEMRTKI